jgi:hypothetical protein
MDIVAACDLLKGKLEDFTSKNVISLGLEADCPHCQAKNWSNLAALDYRIICDRCLKPHDFPQARIREQSKKFYYHVVGPFSVHDYGRGSYASLLALRVINRFNVSMHELTFATAMELVFDGKTMRQTFSRGEETTILITMSSHYSSLGKRSPAARVNLSRSVILSNSKPLRRSYLERQ